MVAMVHVAEAGEVNVPKGVETPIPCPMTAPVQSDPADLPVINVSTSFSAHVDCLAFFKLRV